MFDKALEMIKTYNTIIIHRHNKPDGDAIGSQVGLKNILIENFPDKKVYVVGDDARFYGFINDSNMDVIEDSTFDGALSIILDCGSSSLISDDRYKKSAKTLRFDHHIFCEDIADVDIVDSSFESCCGLIAEFAYKSNLKLNPTAAMALYTGMVTDSGRFRYDSTNSRTHRLASFIMEQEFDTNDIYRNLYADTYENKKLKAEFVLKIKFTPHNVAYIYTTLDEFKALNTDTFTISRGMVNTMADMKGVNIWANFTETENGVLCELRSGLYNINPIAVKYGGGGHAKASGATVADFDTAMAMLRDLDMLEEQEK